MHISFLTGIRADAQVLGATAREENHVYEPDHGADQYAATAPTTEPTLNPQTLLRPD